MKDITLTLAERHQICPSGLMATKGFKDEVLPVHGNICKFEDLDLGMAARISQISGACGEILVSSSVKENGVRYDSQTCIILDVVKVCASLAWSNCFIHLSQCYFVLHEMLTNNYDQDHHAYVVENSHRKWVLQSKDFVDHYPLPLYIVGRRKYVVMEYRFYQENIQQ